MNCNLSIDIWYEFTSSDFCEKVKVQSFTFDFVLSQRLDFYDEEFNWKFVLALELNLIISFLFNFYLKILFAKAFEWLYLIIYIINSQ